MDLSGRLVRLRPLRDEDAEPMVALLADPAIVATLSPWAVHPYALEDARRFLEQRPADEVRWAVEVLDGGRFIGCTGLRAIDRRSRNAEWGIWTGPPAVWGRGYGTEACRLATRFGFEHLGLEKVWLTVLADHTGGRRAYEKAGYRLEGELPRHALRDGELRSVLVMSAFRDDPLYASAWT